MTLNEFEASGVIGIILRFFLQNSIALLCNVFVTIIGVRRLFQLSIQLSRVNSIRDDLLLKINV